AFPFTLVPLALVESPESQRGYLPGLSQSSGEAYTRRETSAGARPGMPDSVHHILLVEDSEDDALLIRAELRKLQRNLQFRRVDTLVDMRAALAERLWDLIITDHNMPGFDSVQAVEELRRSGQDVPLIIMSGTLPEQIGALAMLTGASDFIDKTHRARLIPVVERELRNTGIRRAKDAVERTLVHLTYHDALTGLPNRAMLERMIDHHVATKSGGRVRSALVFLDLDRFLRVNEALGYAGGDEILKLVAARLAQTVGDGGAIARIGEDNFAVYVEHVADESAARDVARRISAMFEQPFCVGADSLFVHSSIGVCMYPDCASTAAMLISNAERAKFDAKIQGPGNVVMYARPAGQANLFNDPLRLESALREAVAREELFLLYQPIVDVHSGKLVGTEALVRWRNPRHGIVGPNAFIPLAEEIGLIVDLGQWVLAHACRQTQAWHDLGMTSLSVAVNVSASQFRVPGFVGVVAAALSNSGLDAQFLELELIESELMEDVEATIVTLKQLKAMGVQLSIDDFGTGYSSLSYLSRLPIDALKIDKSFLQGVEADTENRAIAGTIVALAKCLRLSIVAEGVETAAQLAFVQEMNCDRAQGYLIARPLDPLAIPQFGGMATTPAAESASAH
ncbi:MAG TPA: GGDEF domain-containing response regulator, partial [Casimicrobiaceae bacterium]